MKKILSANDLTVKKGDIATLDSVSFSIYDKEIVGIVGENGAGKTTLFKSLLGLEKPKSGNVYLYNNNKFSGHLIENPKFYEYLSGKDNLKITNNLNSHESDYKKTITSFEMNDYITKKVSHYSLGMKQKLGIANALLIDGNILILDEPTNGLDPKVKEKILNQLLEENRSRNKTILLSSHNLEDLQSICNRFLFFEKGKLMKDISKKEFERLNGGYNLLKIKKSFINQAFDLLSPQYEIEVREEVIRIKRKDTHNILKALILENIEILELKPYKFDLKEHYFN